VVIACLTAVTLPLAGCGNKAGDLTCQAFGEMSVSDRSKALNNLLSEHSLEVASVGNQMGVAQNVDSFCGSPAMLQMPATQNLDRTLNDAVNWDAERW